VNGDDRRPGQALITILWYVRRCGSVVCVSQQFGPALSLSLSLSLFLDTARANVNGTPVRDGPCTERDRAGTAGVSKLSAAARPLALGAGPSSAAATAAAIYVAHSFFLRSLSFVLLLGAFSN